MIIKDLTQIQEGDIIRAFINPEDFEFDAVYAIGIVDEPAVRQHLVLQNEKSEIKTTEYIKVVQSSVDKNIIYAPLMIPNQLIKKYTEDGVMFYMYYEAEDIKKSAENFMQRFSQKNITINHELIAEEVTVVESWIIDQNIKPMPKIKKWDEVVEKTWMVGMRINNIDILNKIKNGELTGVSIEALFVLEKVGNKKIENRASKEDDIVSEIELIINENLNK